MSGSTGSPLSDSVRESSPSCSATWKSCAYASLLGMHSWGPTLSTPSIRPCRHAWTAAPRVKIASPASSRRIHGAAAERMSCTVGRAGHPRRRAARGAPQPLGDGGDAHAPPPLLQPLDDAVGGEGVAPDVDLADE